MVVRSLDIHKDPFRPQENEEELIGDETPYLSAIGELMYIANNTRPDICFAVSLLARFSSSPAKRHWNGVKHIFRYLQGTIDMRLFYSNKSKSELIGYADAGYLSDSHKVRSQTSNLFTYGGTTISWHSMKQTLATTSSNNAEIIAIHEASRECVWLRSMTQHIQEMCGFPMKRDIPTALNEDNVASIVQLKGDTLKETKQNTFHQNSFSLMILRRKVK
ncbi:secreted RxLR effector protein 161-like [Solanum stenotomum]|uniref:secreted RxLR effector protein 161-like n=1 Tax=Solanum stenotomum TaxID=172797 RepID=UPI0020D07D67|nr:secreted RxLR effector protein 161-like [Solanum stenotomum]